MITREEALRRVKGYLTDAIPSENYDEVEEIMSALEQPWIPVSKRLPTHNEYVKNNGLFNVSDGNRSYSACFDIYETKMFGEPTVNGFRIDHAVTAWMPIQEPYKAKSEEV